MPRFPSVPSLAALGLAAVFSCTGALAQVKHGSKDEAQAMVKKAVAHYKSAGKDKALADFNQKGGAFTDRDLYVYTADMSGKCTSHGANEKLVGRDLLQLKDADGKAFVTEILEKGKTGKGGWTDYKWPNPVSKEIEAKTTYCEPHDNQMFCVGAYK
ncbi:cache domain-containing protein [Ideonella sp. DXS22W]|uniref:Cache domain-containing protein n=1 Tax=Pseudaquabacterium inlustre TaxID=2984192 RepID=A0ABU9CLN9_9BURK